MSPKTKSPIDFYSSCLVSEHALERLIRRSRCHSLQEIIAVAQRYFLAVLDKEVSGALDDMSDFIVVGPDGYMPCRRSEEDSTPVVLSWIPRNLWTPQQEAKLTLLSDRCEENDEITVVDEAAFNGSCFLDPALY